MLLLYLFISVISIITIEIFCEGFKTYYRPSLILVTIAFYLREFFTRCGKFLAWLSSLINYKKIYELLKNINENIIKFINNICKLLGDIIGEIFDIIHIALLKLINPIIDILFSWSYFFKGYYDYAKTLLPKSRKSIYITTSIIVLLVVFCIFYILYIFDIFDINLILYKKLFIQKNLQEL